MLRSYLSIAFRHLIKNKVFSIINVLGLAVALTASFFIIQYAAFEMSFDRSQAHHERVYRIALEQYENGAIKQASARSYPGIYNFVNESLPEVKAATRFVKIPANTGFLFGYRNKIYNEAGGFINADSNFFKVFPQLLLRAIREQYCKTSKAS